MIVNNSTGFNLTSIIGYGTFITRNLWKDKANVEICRVNNFTRIYPNNSWFPYALRSNGSFKALKFDVKKQELETLDRIEGVSEGLFERLTADIYLKDNMKSSAFIYVPTDTTIKSQNLSLELDKTDRWKEEILKCPEVIDKFPELIT
ncbi:MAG: gamma-glutamylcyclotransferase [Candidatus Lokiarchaeota archaeon]|nr:gamma-glutamylcyclotransferase [Candidatus Lokiarchaeota archaeon]